MNNHKLKLTISVIIVMALTAMLILSYPVSAQQAPTPPEPTWTGNFTVKATQQFVWLRVAPQSTASVIATVYPNQILIAAQSPDAQTQIYDGTQWWGFVNVPAVALSGWVEIASLQLGPLPTPTPTVAPEVVAPWGISTAVRVRAAVAFLWLRQKPSSDGLVLYQVPAGSVMVTIAPPQSDGTQNWWPVQDVQSGVIGWAEQNSLEPASLGLDIATATLVPVPTPESWTPGNKLRVRDNITVSAVRAMPNLRGQILARISAGNILDLVGTPLFGDGDWWWLVKTRGTNITGWVPQSALEIAPSDA